MIKLKSLLAEEDVVKNKKTGNVYVVQSFDPNKHDKPSPAEIEKTKQANNGVLPKSEPQPKQKKSDDRKKKPRRRSSYFILLFFYIFYRPEEAGRC